jgi:AraC-like DNA-binding protein
MRPSSALYTSAAHCRPFARQLRVCGADPQTLLKQLGLTEAEMERFEVFLPTHKFMAFVRGCLETSQDRDLGLHAGEQVGIEDLGMLGLILRGSAAAQDAYEAAQQYRRLWWDAQDVELTLTEQGIVCRQLLQARTISRQWGEYFAAMTLSLARAVLDDSVDPVEVRFSHPAPEHLGEHERIFGGARLVFGASDNEVVFAPLLLQRTLPHADASVVRVLTPYADRQCAITRSVSTPDLAARVKNVALDKLKDGQLTLRDVARALHQSERTLCRQLSASATSFREIVNQLRRDLALHYLEQGLSSVELSKQLGFSETSAFHRAFKRWMGQSVGAYRRRARPAVPELGHEAVH